jgi:tetratricopeptide (TPR) repeat protein
MMNAFFQMQFPGAVCLVFLATISVSSLGCREPAQTAAEQQVTTQQVEMESAEDDAFQTPPPLLILVDQARQNVEQQNLNDAIEKYTTVLQHRWPDSVQNRNVRKYNAEIFLLRGQAFLANELPTIAIGDFGDAIFFGDDDLQAKAYFERATAEAKLENWRRVVADCTRAIRLQPKNGQAYLLHGRAFAEMGKYDLARNSMLQAEQLGIRTTRKVPIPEPRLPVLEQAQISLDLNRPIVALEILEKAKQEGNDTWEMNGLLSRTLFQLNEFDRAITVSTSTLRQNPESADAYRIRGLSRLQRGSFDRAIGNLETAIALEDSLTEQLKPHITEARRRGGIHPEIRAEAILQIKVLAGAESESASVQSEAEQWLLELIEIPNSSGQIDHFSKLMTGTSEARFDSLNWLADFLMLEFRVPAVNAIRTWLDRESPEVLPLEKRLWESVASRKAAAGHGVNMYPDLASYAIAYEFNDVLRACIDLRICQLNIDHMHQAVERADTRYLRLIVPHTVLTDREVAGLLRHCVEKNKPDHVRLIIRWHERSLTCQILEFLDLATEPASS